MLFDGRICLIATLLLCSLMPLSAAPLATAPALLATLKPTHPRLLAAETTWEDLKTRRQSDALLDAFLKRNEVEARALLDAPPVVYKKDGRRLLRVSRTVLRRVLLLAMQFHLTGEAAFARRAEAEMLTVAAFTDWNPSHFLDTAEMTTALALGTDWLFDELSANARQIIENAIIEKGLRAALTTNGWLKIENNWNSVCCCGMALGALAVAEKAPDLAAQTLENVQKFNGNGLKTYAPDGVYPEGAMYWSYGTTFQAVLIASLRTALGTDWNLSQSAGFMQSADALLHQLGPTGAFFNFSDGTERPSGEAGLWWYAHELKRPDLLRAELPRLKALTESKAPPQPASEANRLLPLAALWWPDFTVHASTQAPLNWLGNGPNQIATFRSAADDPRAMFLALKAGGANLSHAHMDAGSFVFEWGGVRWACDLGPQDYLSLESKDIDLWNRAQNSPRWDVFRLGPFSHNTLVINGQKQDALGFAKITNFCEVPSVAGAIVDLSPVFAGQASRVTRAFAFEKQQVTTRDELEGLKPGGDVRWAMLTKAEIALSDDKKEAILSRGGQKLRVSLQASGTAGFEIISADPPHDYDAPNPGYQLLVVHLLAPESGKVGVGIVLSPENVPSDAKLAHTEIRIWPISQLF